MTASRIRAVVEKYISIMPLTDYLMIFVGGFASVFTLGFQSRVVNGGHYWMAAFMSFLIAMFQAHLWTLIVKQDGDIMSSIVYGLSGMAAITSAMFVHQHFFVNKRKQDEDTGAS